MSRQFETSSLTPSNTSAIPPTPPRERSEQPPRVAQLQEPLLHRCLVIVPHRLHKRPQGLLARPGSLAEKGIAMLM